MGSQFASKRIALGVCDVCGFQYKLKTLKSLSVMGRDTNLKACKECWSPDHPQLKLGERPVSDPQAIENPRTDFATYAQSRAQLIPVYSVAAAASVNSVTVEVM
jgi:hypothetical protein